jgi:hypothetical protein
VFTCRSPTSPSINGEVKDGKTMDEAVNAWTDSHADLIKRWENIKKNNFRPAGRLTGVRPAPHFNDEKARKLVCGERNEN